MFTGYEDGVLAVGAILFAVVIKLAYKERMKEKRLSQMEVKDTLTR